MKKFFEYFGMTILICFSFFITEQTATVVKEIDDIMVQIRENYLSYTRVGANAIINNDGMIPGLATKKVNIEKSYQQMSEKGIYDSNFYVYDFESPNTSISDIFDKKIISGNNQKKMVSLVFVIENSNDDKIYKLIEKAVPINIILEISNIDKVMKILNDNSNMNILVEANTENNYQLLNTKLKSIGLKIDYCYNELSNWCIENKVYTLAKKDVITSKPLYNVKNKLSKENILVFKLNEEVLKELPNIVQYIYSKGYTIEPLTEHLSENW